MYNPLSKLSQKEFKELFPIILADYNFKYKLWYELEKSQLFNIIGGKTIKRINHIGSTAIEGIISKPIVDILLEIDSTCNILKLIQLFNKNNWNIMSEEYTPYLNLIFNKGYTINGFAEKVYHLHVRFLGDWNELYFKDYLLEYTKISNRYSKLKIKLLAKYKYNRKAYTEGKTQFIEKYTKKARNKYTDRYLPVGNK